MFVCIQSLECYLTASIATLVASVLRRVHSYKLQDSTRLCSLVILLLFLFNCVGVINAFTVRIGPSPEGFPASKRRVDGKPEHEAKTKWTVRDPNL